jgi:hypothetical protein
MVFGKQKQEHKFTSMKSIISFLILILFFQSVCAQKKASQNAYKRGEVLEYKAYYGIIDAARAKLVIEKEFKKVGNRMTYHAIASAVSLGAFNWFFKVVDNYQTYIDNQVLLPLVFFRRVEEGGYILARDKYFNQTKHTVRVVEPKKKKEGIYKTEKNVQDLLSCFYHGRTLNLQHAKPGDVFTIPVFFDYENYPMRIKFLGKEVLKTDLGTFRCLKYSPQLQEGRVFKDQEDMTIWLTDDQNKIPIRLKAELLIGSIKLDLTSYSGLVGPIAKIK